MYNNLSGHAARAINDEIRRSATRPERLMAEEAASLAGPAGAAGGPGDRRPSGRRRSPPGRRPPRLVEPVETPGADLRAGARAMAPMLVAYAPFGLLVGAAVAASANPLAAWLATWTIYGGAAHLAVLDVLAHGSGWMAAAAVGLLVNVRLTAYATAMAPEWRSAPVAAAGPGRGDADRRDLGAGPRPGRRAAAVLPGRRAHPVPRLARAGHPRRAHRRLGRHRARRRPAATADPRRRGRHPAPPAPGGVRGRRGRASPRWPRAGSRPGRRWRSRPSPASSPDSPGSVRHERAPRRPRRRCAAACCSG